MRRPIASTLLQYLTVSQLAELHDITIASLDCLTEYFGVIGKQDKPEAPSIVSDCWDIAWPAVVGVMQTCSTEDILKV